MRKFTLLLLFFSVATPFLVSFSQTPEKNTPALVSINMKQNIGIPEEGGIVAALIADVRSGYAPLPLLLQINQPLKFKN